jgi:hypothetical protein
MNHLGIGAAFFSAAAAVSFGVIALGLRTGRTLGLAFRSRLIARRRQEPGLYWMSLAIFAVFGLLCVVVVINNVGLGL